MKKEHFMNISSKSLLVAALFLNYAGRVEAAPGDLDPGFGAGGRVIAQNGNDEKAYAAALSADGKIVVAGERPLLSEGMVVTRFELLARFNTDGALDAAFGSGGKRMIDFFNYQDFGRAALVQPDGKIVVAGYRSSDNGDGDNDDIALARFLP